MVGFVLEAYNRCPKDCVVIAAGACAISQGIYYKSYNDLKNAADILPVDIFITGCPPSPEDLLKGLKKCAKI
jgi:NADH-quinone oxidoreductase subunit B